MQLPNSKELLKEWIMPGLILAVLTVTAVINGSTGVTIQPCPVEVAENTVNYVVTCTNIKGTDTVNWLFRQPDNVEVEVAVCHPENCEPYFNNLSPSRPSGNVSTLTIVNATRAKYADGGFICDSSSSGKSDCQVDVTYPANVESCTIQPVTSDTTWNVKGTCNITKVFSSLKRYFCQLRWQKQGTSDIYSVSKTLYSPTLTNATTPYAYGTCSYTAPLPTENDMYTYSVMPFPGKASTQAGKLTVEAPSSTPMITCTHSGTQYIPENTTLKCTCTASSLGQPKGRLIGCRNNTRLNVGIYGVSNLTLDPQRISRQDNGTSLTCVLDWAKPDVDDLKSGIYTAVVAYGPDNVTLKGPEEFDLHPTASSSLTLECRASLSNPEVTFVWNCTCDGRTSGSTCIFTPNITDNNKIITCTVTNTAIQVTRTASWTVALNYPPDTAPTIVGYMNDDILYAGHSLTMVCTVIGGIPLVGSVNFSCDNRQDGNDVFGQNGVSSNVTFTSLVAADHGVSCTCKAEWKNIGWYTLTDNRRLIVYYSTERAKLNLNGLSHNVTVNESDFVLMTCRANGRPTPTMRLLHSDAMDEKKKSDGDLLRADDLDSWLNFSLNEVQCHQAGKYVCTARNVINRIITDESFLFVNCKPRRNGSASTPEANFQGKPQQLSFDVIAYPTPDRFRFIYVGTDQNVTGNATAVRENILSIRCFRTNIVYLATCSITVDNMTDADAGNYSVTVANAFGDVEVSFRLLFNETKMITVSGTQKRDPPYGDIAGGVVAAVVVAAGLVVLVVFVMRRRAGIKNSTARSQRKTSGKTPEIIKENEHALGGKDDDDAVMIDNDLYGRSGKTAAHESQTCTPQRSEYEDVSLPPAVKPHVQPKPQVEAKMSTANYEKDTYLVIQKGNKPLNNLADTVEYASVSKSKTATVSGQNGEAAIRTGTTAKNKSVAMQKPSKKPKPAKNKFKGKAQKQEKGAEYGNTPLSMNPIDCKVYENFGFQNEESETKPRDLPQEPAADQRSGNKDGLVYTKIQFTESQQQKAENNPPKRETTEYVSIVFNKQPLVSGE